MNDPKTKVHVDWNRFTKGWGSASSPAHEATAGLFMGVFESVAQCIIPWDRGGLPG